MANKPTLLGKKKKPSGDFNSLEDFLKIFNSSSDEQLKPLISKRMLKRMERIMNK